MSVTIDTPVETVSQRSARATREFCAALGLGNVKPKDLTLLTIALAEVATRETKHNKEFADQVRRAFHELATNAPAKSKPKKVDVFEELIPIGRVDLSRLRPSGPLDPFALYEGYGEEQTQRVLSGLTLDNLKRSAAIVEEQNPGTKPTGRATKKALVDYVMRYMRSA